MYDPCRHLYSLSIVVMATLIICASSYAATINADLLRYYKKIYAEEIFEYCLDKHTRTRAALGTCMQKNEKLKTKILKNTQYKLGSQFLAERIYNECADYHPVKGVARIGDCVKTRLVLDDKLGFYLVEIEIYQKCNDKWGKYGAGAVDNCSRHEANYFREKGEFLD